ncbi:MAG: Het-C domain-containing protein, partial [Bacteroidota bacterium]|nr:Het-C domain-containing protein [Bacteroidota bacterium]
MRPAILTSLFVVFGGIANGQLTILPQLGFENSRTTIKYNGLSSFSPLSARLSPQASVRLDYKFKQGHGPFLGLATSRSVVEYSFTDPETGMKNYIANRGDLQIRIEGGYLFSSKPIIFSNSHSSNKFSKTPEAKNTAGRSCGEYTVTKSCGGFSATSSHCGSKSNCSSRTPKTSEAKARTNRTWMKIQPLLGIAFIPGNMDNGINAKSMGGQTSYAYNAGNWKTAIISGAGLEFGKNAQSKFMVSFNYLKGISNLDKQNITTVAGTK